MMSKLHQAANGVGGEKSVNMDILEWGAREGERRV